jgi:hypothetical protein
MYMLNVKPRGILVFALLLSAGSGVVAKEGEKKAVPQKDGPARLWEDLASTDEARASRALLALAARPKVATAYLKEQLKPVKVNEDALKKLIAQMDNDDFAVRAAATKLLTAEADYLGRFARPFLEKTLKGGPSQEVKKRIETILELLPRDPRDQAKDPPREPVLRGRSVAVSSNNGAIQIIIDGKPLDLSTMVLAVPPRPNTQWLRAARAVALLESLDTPEARSILESLASGELDAPPTRDAKAALERLTKAK